MIVACDVDGVLANVLPWLHLLPDNWEEYFKHTLEFEPITQNIDLIQSLMDEGHTIYFITGRPEKNREDTETWLIKYLNRYNYHNCKLFMRKPNDHREGRKIKLEYYKLLNPSIIFDDAPDVVEIAKSNGFCVMQVHGYRMGNSDGIPFSNKEFREESFSFKEYAVGYQSPEQTLLILTYELGKLIEYNHKAKIYGETAYYSNENQQKEMSDLISMARYYCELKDWNFNDLLKLGEQGYLERMKDIKKYGIESREIQNAKEK